MARTAKHNSGEHTVLGFAPHEITKPEIDMVTHVYPYLESAITQSAAAGVPIEATIRGLCVAAGIGLAQAYPLPGNGSRVALAKACNAMRGAYRFAISHRED